MKYLWGSGQLFPASNSFSDSILSITSNCQHPIHPGHPKETVDNCPVCVAQQCVGALARISRTWDALGGPSRGDDEISNLSMKIRSLWYAEKQRWATIVHMFGEYAERERHWEVQYPELVELLKVREAKSCQLALRVAFDCPYMSEGAEIPFKRKRTALKLCLGPPRDEQPSLEANKDEERVPKNFSPYRNKKKSTPTVAELETDVAMSLSYPPQPKNVCSTLVAKEPQAGKKRVSFAEDTVEPTYRESSNYHRKSRSYQPGRYATIKPPSTRLLEEAEDSDRDDSSSSTDWDDDGNSSDGNASIENSLRALRSNYREVASTPRNHDILMHENSVELNNKQNTSYINRDYAMEEAEVEEYGVSNTTDYEVIETDQAIVGGSRLGKRRRRFREDEGSVFAGTKKRRSELLPQVL